MRSIAFAVLCVAFTLLGCSSGGSGSAGGGGTATGGGSGGGGTAAGGGSSDSGVPLKYGEIVIVQSCSTASGTERCQTSGSGTFATETVTTGNPNCTQSTVDGCLVAQCAISDGGTVSLMHASAGTLTIGGTLIDGGISLAYDGMGYGLAFMQRAWSGGESVTLSATGATVPAFSAMSLIAPADVAVTSPACASFDCGAISRTEGLTVSWSGASSGVSAGIESSGPAYFVSITCPLTTNPSTISAAVLAHVGATDAGFLNTFSLNASSSTRFTAGDYSVTFIAGGSGVTGELTTSN